MTPVIKVRNAANTDWIEIAAAGPPGPAGLTGPIGVQGPGWEWKGTWVNATAYNGDSVNGHDVVGGASGSAVGSSYICKDSHTSASDTEPGIGAHSSMVWDILAERPSVAGLPDGGTTGQVLEKASDTDGDATWADPAAGTGVPDGGTTGQVLAKASDTDGDATWADPATGTGVPDGGTTGQVLAKASGTDGDATWTDLPGGDGMPEAPYKSVQFNKAGAFGGDRNLKWGTNDLGGLFLTSDQAWTAAGLAGLTATPIDTEAGGMNMYDDEPQIGIRVYAFKVIDAVTYLTPAYLQNIADYVDAVSSHPFNVLFDWDDVAYYDGFRVFFSGAWYAYLAVTPDWYNSTWNHYIDVVGASELLFDGTVVDSWISGVAGDFEAVPVEVFDTHLNIKLSETGTERPIQVKDYAGNIMLEQLHTGEVGIGSSAATGVGLSVALGSTGAVNFNAFNASPLATFYDSYNSVGWRIGRIGYDTVFQSMDSNGIQGSLKFSGATLIGTSYGGPIYEAQDRGGLLIHRITNDLMRDTHSPDAGTETYGRQYVYGRYDETQQIIRAMSGYSFTWGNDSSDLIGVTINSLYTGTGVGYYVVEISANGTPDSFRWNKDGGTWSGDIEITGAVQDIAEGITITFPLTTGYSIGQTTTISYWGDQTVNLSEWQAGDGTVLSYIDKDGNGFFPNITDGAGIPDGGTTGQVLAKASDTDGDAAWVDPTSGGAAAGVEGSIQFNYGGTFGGDTNLTYDPATGVLSNYAINQVQITRGYASLALQIQGGAGYEPEGGNGKNIYLTGGAKARSFTGASWGEIAVAGSGYEPNAYVEVFLVGGDGLARVGVETDGDGIPLYVSDFNATGYGYSLGIYETTGASGSGLTIDVTTLYWTNIPDTHNGAVTVASPLSVGNDDGYPFTGQLRVASQSDIVTERILAFTGQTASLTEWDDHTSTKLASIDIDGSINALNINKDRILLNSQSDTPAPNTLMSTLIIKTVGVGNQKLLMHFDTDIVDDSSLQNVVNYAGVVASDTQAYFGGKSAYFDGSSYAIVDSSGGWDFGLGDFTIDFWMYRTDNSLFHYFGILSTSIDIYNEGWTIYCLDDDYIRFANNGGGGTDLVTSGSLTVPLNTWTHVALVRKGTGETDLNFYINGVAGDAPASGNITLNRPNGAGELAIGRVRTQDPSWLYYGYIDELQIRKGEAAWTTDFDVPTSAYEPDSYYNTLEIIDSYGLVTDLLTTGGGGTEITLDATADILMGISSGILSLDTQVANTLLAGPATGADAAPTFRSLTADDIPDHKTSHATGGTDVLSASDIGAVDTGDSRLTDSRTPTSHASSHENGGGDEVATATPTANAIPKADGTGKLADGWIAAKPADIIMIQVFM